MAQTCNSLGSTPDIRVFIRNTHGKYLAQDEHGLFFSADHTRAVVLNYQADHVQEQLAAIKRGQGIDLVADPVPLEEIYETCDHCKELFMPFMTVFDGRRFLCLECHARFGQKRVMA